MGWEKFQNINDLQVITQRRKGKKRNPKVRRVNKKEMLKSLKLRNTIQKATMISLNSRPKMVKEAFTINRVNLSRGQYERFSLTRERAENIVRTQSAFPSA